MLNRRLQYNLIFSPKQSLSLSIPRPINDGTWYLASVIRLGNWAQLTLSHPTGSTIASVNGTAEGPDQLLSVAENSIFVSGRTNSFDGCLSGVRLDGFELPFTAPGNRFFQVLSSSLRSSEGGCQLAQCQNNATLVPAQGDAQAPTCRCPLGFAGERCEFEIDECASSPCSPAAEACEDLIGGYRCYFREPAPLKKASSSDTLELSLLIVVLGAFVFLFGLALVQRHKARKTRKIHEKAADATVFSRDVVKNVNNQANIMLYHDEGAGEIDLEHINFDEVILNDSALTSEIESARFSQAESTMTMSTVAHFHQSSNVSSQALLKWKEEKLAESDSEGNDELKDGVDDLLACRLRWVDDAVQRESCPDSVCVFADEGSMSRSPLGSDSSCDEDYSEEADDEESMATAFTTLSAHQSLYKWNDRLFQTAFLESSSQASSSNESSESDSL